jgi:glutamate synthase (NADPH/NADH) large chain
VIAGNTIALYGATSGELFLRGIRQASVSAVRNSGATAVIEGVGDHGCEYMTGGTVVVLGPTGRNFAAGMSGGVAYVLDLDPQQVNPELVELTAISGEDAVALRDLVAEHGEETGSGIAAALLEDWDSAVKRFTEVMPRDFRVVMTAKAKAEAAGLDEIEIANAMMEALHG